MAIGLGIYLAGWRYVPADAIETRTAAAPPSATESGGRSRITPLIAIIALNVFYFGTYNQTFNLLPVWAQDFVDRDILGSTLPATSLLAFDGLFGIGAILLLLWVWSKRPGGGDRDGEEIG